ncbi:MAG TPA: L,D-transpeptidase [Candidatus Methylacidiphilales bacterium]|nr:L,D-transpeptidase [Candidatus Methylacidiphilales bacterium]
MTSPTHFRDATVFVLRVVLTLAALMLTLCGCSPMEIRDLDLKHRIVVSIPDQKMAVYQDGLQTALYDISTSKYGLGDEPGSYKTPLGKLIVAEKIGDGAPVGQVFKGRKPTREVLPVDSPGRDPIVTRILWLRGVEDTNLRSYDRTIYIHGTPQERFIGKPVSYGCIRMRSRDIVELYNTVGKGAVVEIVQTHLIAPMLIPTRLAGAGSTRTESEPPVGSGASKG